MALFSRIRGIAARCLSGVNRVVAVVAVVLGLSAGSALAQTTPALDMTGIEPSTVANTVLDIVVPFIPTVITIAVTISVALLVYKVIMRKVWGFGHGA